MAEELELGFANRTGGGCVPDGPFSGIAVRLGPWNGTGLNARCLVRDFAPALAGVSFGDGVIEKVLAQPDYWSFTTAGDALHNGGHGAVGGKLGNVSSSLRRFGRMDPEAFVGNDC